MDSRPGTPHQPQHVPDQAVLTEVSCTWEEASAAAAAAPMSAVVLHAAQELLILQTDADGTLPPAGTRVHVEGPMQQWSGRLAEQGRNGRFLVSTSDRPVRRSLRLRVSLPALLRAPGLAQPTMVEVVDLNTGGARVRGVELPVHSHVTLDFTPPGRQEPVTVRASVAHSTRQAKQPWIGVTFRLVALRGGREHA